MDLKHKVVSGLKWTTIAKLTTQIFSWASTIVVIRLLEPSDYGLMAIGLIFIELCKLFNEMGLAPAVIQSKIINDTILRQAFSIILFINLTLCIILMSSSGLIAYFFDDARLTNLIIVLSLQFIFIAFTVLPIALLTRDMNYKPQTIINIISEFSAIIVTLSLAYNSFGYWSLAYGSLTGVIVRAIGLNIVSPFIKLPTFKFKGISKLTKFGGMITMNQILWYMYSEADVFIVGKILGGSTLGVYSIALNISSLPLQKVSSLLNQVGFPAFSKLQDKRELAVTYTKKAIRLLGFISFPVFFGISAIAPELVNVVLGEKWIEAIIPIQLLSLIVPLRSINIGIKVAVNGLGHPEVLVKNTAIACVILPIAFFIGVQYGLLGVSLAWLIAYPLWFTYATIKALEVIRLPMNNFLKELWIPAMISTAMLFLVHFGRMTLESFALSDLSVLIMIITFSVIFYTSFSLLFCRNIYKEMFELWKS